MSKSKKRENSALAFCSPPWNFSWVVKGEICACAWPESEANIAFLRSKGVRVLVCLSVERQPHRSAKKHMECHVIDVEEFEDPAVEQMSEFISICEKAREEKKVMCVHCRMGRGRTGVMLACYLVRFYQQEPSQAICNVRLMRPGSVETWDQERAVRNYRDYMG
ncbi:dual specificity protein phosphatase 23 [Penaeus vannamei]|uniref:Dual specificity protein phosphatase 23 n=1 Tax=Penaeus vannamei TaxID=6689 RepID=A0A423SRW5_PENVA|nr:dual specificity protein phosphatase 23-like [Penaeus vannamei]ROT66950.1 putative dual specificity protein phosphatase 23-like isoform X1 [Penaeus vannamei]